ncbi:MAG: molybdenum cofactor guanylyltransferase [Chloroflexi bacterium]|nr:molybdenum cofactor guanylyltransferase [Chloroflexota bacterium]
MERQSELGHAVLPVSGAVLAGGRGVRLGRDKARVAVGGATLLDRAIATLASFCTDVLVVGRTGDFTPRPDVRALPDLRPGSGALGGIYTALVAAAHPLCVVVACDMPFLNPALLRYLAALGEHADVVTPLVHTHPETLHAVYRRTCIPHIEAQLDRGDFKIARFFDAVRVRYVERAEITPVDPDLRSLFNINHPDELAAAQAAFGDSPTATTGV